MSDSYFEHAYGNGLHLLVEPMPDVRSAAFTFLVPCGVAREAADASGAANVLSRLVTRGAGRRDNRELTLSLDNLGIQRSESAEIYHTSFTAASLADNLVAGLEILADIVRRPRLEPQQLEYCKQQALQELAALEDEPTHKIYVELKRRALPDPLGRPILGSEGHVAGIGSESVADLHARRYQPNGAILGVAGAVELSTVRDAVGRLFDDWQPGPNEPVAIDDCCACRDHIVSEKVQTYIGVAFKSVAFGDPDYFNAHGAVGVLSGGMSARLPTELREKRGLCYGVGASFYPLKDRGLVACYAGTTNERAGETLEVLLAELRRLGTGIMADEVGRVQAGLKSALVMQEESTSARASILARSWFHLGRVRTLAEVAREIDQMSCESILAYLDRHPPGDFTILTLGPHPLEVAS